MAGSDDKIVIKLRVKSDISHLMRECLELELDPEKPWVVTISQEEAARSLKQNRLSFLWYRARGKATGHGGRHERKLCKLLYGVPILCQGEEFQEFWSSLSGLTYEQKLEAMEFVPVTSLFGVKQFAEYLDTIDQESASQGIVLPQPADLYLDALMRDAENYEL
jgi:hypothetical protein